MISLIGGIIYILKLTLYFMSQIMQMYIVYALQIIIAIGLINVWLIRFHKPTKYRGGSAGNMIEEFATYGLPKWFMYLVGMAKILIAVCMIAGFWMPVLVYPASILLAVLMVGAISMHIKVKDSFIKSVPAILVLLMAVANILLIGFK
jgi:hypothetical protein